MRNVAFLEETAKAIPNTDINHSGVRVIFGSIYQEFDYYKNPGWQAITRDEAEVIMRTNQIVKAVRDHAFKHYNEGWDIIVEAWDDDDIIEATKETTTVEEAINEIGETVGVIEERHQEMRAMYRND